MCPMNELPGVVERINNTYDTYRSYLIIDEIITSECRTIALSDMLHVYIKYIVIRHQFISSFAYGHLKTCSQAHQPYEQEINKKTMKEKNNTLISLN